MSNVNEIETAVSQLSPEDLSAFRSWFSAFFDAEQWDRQFEHDVASGRLNKLAEKAIKDFQKQLPLLSAPSV